MKRKSKLLSKKQGLCVLTRLMVCSVVLILGWNLAYGADSDSSAGQNSLKLKKNEKPKPAWDFDTDEDREPDPNEYQLPAIPPIDLSPDISVLNLYLHHWPNKEETAIIMKYAKEHGLRRTELDSVFKIWIFKWDEPKSFGVALRICDGFPKLPSVKHCSPLDPASIGYPTKHSAGLSSPQVSHYNTCNLAKDHRKYWAQNLIGADLLREELKKKAGSKDPYRFI